MTDAQLQISISGRNPSKTGNIFAKYLNDIARREEALQFIMENLLSIFSDDFESIFGNPIRLVINCLNICRARKGTWSKSPFLSGKNCYANKELSFASDKSKK